MEPLQPAARSSILWDKYLPSIRRHFSQSLAKTEARDFLRARFGRPVTEHPIDELDARPVHRAAFVRWMQREGLVPTDVDVAALLHDLRSAGDLCDPVKVLMVVLIDPPAFKDNRNVGDGKPWYVTLVDPQKNDVVVLNCAGCDPAAMSERITKAKAALKGTIFVIFVGASLDSSITSKLSSSGAIQVASPRSIAHAQRPRSPRIQMAALQYLIDHAIESTLAYNDRAYGQPFDIVPLDETWYTLASSEHDTSKFRAPGCDKHSFNAVMSSMVAAETGAWLAFLLPGSHSALLPFSRFLCVAIEDLEPRSMHILLQRATRNDSEAVRRGWFEFLRAQKLCNSFCMADSKEASGSLWITLRTRKFVAWHIQRQWRKGNLKAVGGFPIEKIVESYDESPGDRIIPKEDISTLLPEDNFVGLKWLARSAESSSDVLPSVIDSTRGSSAIISTLPTPNELRSLARFDANSICPIKDKLSTGDAKKYFAEAELKKALEQLQHMQAVEAVRPPALMRPLPIEACSQMPNELYELMRLPPSREAFSIGGVRESFELARSKGSIADMEPVIDPKYREEGGPNYQGYFSIKWPMNFPRNASDLHVLKERTIAELCALCSDIDNAASHFRFETAVEGSIVLVFALVGVVAVSGAALCGAWILGNHLHRYFQMRQSRAQQSPHFFMLAQFQLNPPANVVLSRPYPRILSLDGGGTRSIVTLRMLLELENQLRARPGLQNARISDLFDWIVGTSTGGLIAIALRGGQDVTQILNAYQRLTTTVFARGFFVDIAGFFRVIGGGSWYSHTSLEQFINANFQGQQQLGSLAGVALTTTNLTTRNFYLLTSVHHPNIRIVEAARMTTAAPGYFPPVLSGGDQFVDGGVGNNCPAKKFVFSYATPPHLPPVVVSIGAGETAQPVGGQQGYNTTLYWRRVASSLIDNPTQTAQLAADACTRVTHGWGGQWFRIQPQLARAIDLDATDAQSLRELNAVAWPRGPGTHRPGEVLNALLL